MRERQHTCICEENDMTVSGVSASDSTQIDAQNNNQKKLRDDFNQLQQALSSGSLDQAQQAFSTLQNDLPSGAANGPLGKALASVGDALNNGDVSGAQQAFTAMQQQVKGGGHHHHHHHAQTQQTSANTTDSSSSVGTMVNKIA
jgi:hypothetical protein